MGGVEIRGKSIVITGASSGIGAATALACARAGMPVVLGARRAERLEALRERIVAEGGRAVAVACDVTRPGDCEELAGRAREAFGSVYALFANAGVGAKLDLLETPEATLREIFEVNLFGTVNAVRAAAPGMVEAGSGHILICSSCLSALPSPGYGVYSATKSAQHHLGRALGVELARGGVRVTTVHPVRTETEFFEAMLVRKANAGRARGAGQSAEFVARRIVGALRRPRPEVWMSRPTEIGFKLAALFPRLTDRLVWQPRRER